MDTTYAKHRLPDDQPLIYTSDVKRLIAQVNILSGAEGFPESVGLVVGAPGTGKTIAAHAYVANEESERHVRCAIVDVMPQVTPKGLLSSILHQIGERLRGHTSYDALHQTIDAFQQRQTRLLILDQGDYLQREAIEALSMLVEKTPCSLLLVGLPPLQARLNMVPSFAGRMSLILHFGPLPEAEVYKVFLPQLVLPGWEFHPEREDDLCVGRYLWKHARPSLRSARAILQHAGCLAQMNGSRNITFEDVRMAVRMTCFSHDRKQYQGDEEENEPAKSTRR